jgi:iron-sulfur cluster repair protein YtfE (RIC family)
MSSERIDGDLFSLSSFTSPRALQIEFRSNSVFRCCSGHNKLKAAIEQAMTPLWTFTQTEKYNKLSG